MDRRRFIASGALAALSVGFAGCGDDVTPAPPEAKDPPIDLVSYPPMTFITQDPAYSDYRPAFDSTGTQVLFERTVFPNPNDADTVLYIVTGVGSPTPTLAPFLPAPANPPLTFPYSQTRPDWNWTTGEIAFSGAPTNKATISVHISPGVGKAPRLVPDTLARIYPMWSSDGTQLVVYNESTSASPVKPVSTLIDPTGTVVTANLDGADANNVSMFAGFASPKPGNATQIAYAGQPALASWGVPAGTSPPAAPSYNQDNNYVFLNKPTSTGYASAPLEPLANIATFDSNYQGRAPYWSPDGNYVVFESSRNGGYAIFLANVTKGTAPVQLTASNYWAQHAKFLPGGKSIVFTALQQPSATSGNGVRGIATISIAAYL